MTPLGRFLVRQGKPQDLEPLRDYELLLLHPLTALSRRYNVFVDVGANVGKYTVPLARHYKHVYAVEPDPDNLYALKRNIELNNLSNVTIVPKALGSTRGVVALAQAGAQSRIAPQGIPVEMTTLDECCPDAEVVKIDVEGYELEVVKGALETIKRNRPVLVIEHHEYIFNTPVTWHKEIARILRDHGYVTLRIRYPHWMYIHETMFAGVYKIIKTVIGYHIFHETIMSNIARGLPWYYGLRGTWWYGMDVPEFMLLAHRHITVDEAFGLARAAIERVAR